MFLFLIILSFFLYSCASPKSSKNYTCVDCHQKEKSDHIEVSCIECHSGVEKAASKEEAHKNLKRQLMPSEIEGFCAKCHPKEVKSFKNSLHKTYAKELQSILKGFNLSISIKEMKDLAQISHNLSTKEGIVLDFLRRRCLSCHIFSRGENYRETKRSLYCLSCHKPHSFKKPSDKECLSCHYSTKIGWDYYGYFPHNWFSDYRSPFIGENLPERPYGIEAYLLEEDIHKKKNLKCTSCHKKEEIMEGKSKAHCLSCHNPLKKSIFHDEYVIKKSDCTACHSRFLAKDTLKICYLEENPDWDNWIELAVQESSEIEEKIQAYLSGKKVSPYMGDYFTGEKKLGIWFCTLEDRNFENITLTKNKDGKFCLLRNEKIILIYNDFKIEGTFEICKKAHSIGKGDLIRSLKIWRELKGK